MKRVLIIISLGIVFSAHAQSPTIRRVLKVIYKNEYLDGAFLCAVDTSTYDTIRVVSEKRTSCRKSGCKQVIVGKVYIFFLKDVYGRMHQPMPGLVMKLKTTVVWRSNDGYKNIPLLAENMRGLCIQE